jgi:glutamate--cysteine ligase
LLEANVGWLSRPGNTDRVRRGSRGIEKESLRVDVNGQLAKTPHPPTIGSALTHPYLTTDYSEALLEFVTPPYTSNWQTLQFLCDLHGFVHRRLDGELLWPASMPCVINPNEEIPIAAYGPSNAGQMRTIYRRGLGFRYGRAMQAIAGAHFNFSLPQEFWEAYREYCRADAPLAAFKSEQMMGLVRNYRRCAWLVVYLFGASPAFCKSFRPERHELLQELDRATWFGPYATSLRMSDIGYRNSTQARLSISANSLRDYVAGLTGAVTTADPRYADIGVFVDGEFRQLNVNVLQIENEYYSSVRPKPRDRTIRAIAALRRDGVEYVEIRTLDLNALDPVGVNQAQMRVLEALLLYCLLADSPPISQEEQVEIDARDVQVAREGRRPGLQLSINGRPAGLRATALALLRDVASIASLLDGDSRDYSAAVDAARAAVGDPELTPSAKLVAELRSTDASFFEYGLELARSHRQYFLSLPLDPAKETMLDATAASSLAETKALEARADVPFAEYLERYAETLGGPEGSAGKGGVANL